jgi:hypothetical protein
MIGFGFRPPCKTPDKQAERLSPLVDGEASDARLLAHVETCDACRTVLESLRDERAALAGWGDVPGAAPTDAGFHRIMATLSAEKRARRLPRWAMLTASTALAMMVGGIAVRQLWLQRERRATDDEIVAGADSAYRRAEREYAEALGLLRDRLQTQWKAHPDPQVEAGAKELAAAREKAATLAAQGRADPERQALLREAFRAEIRYYEDALLRGPQSAGDPL